MNTALIFGIDRHRIEIDGAGITTLVTFAGCPLHCVYCLNEQCHKLISDNSKNALLLTPLELYEKVKIDNLYFRFTQGGVTFGGGEPCLYSDFIYQFRLICGWNWKLNIETSLNVPRYHIEKLLPIIDYFFIDIKDMDSNIYKRYTGTGNEMVIDNLLYIKSQNKMNKTTIRIPYIEGYNSNEDILRSINSIHSIGFYNIDKFTYIIKHNNFHETR